MSLYLHLPLTQRWLLVLFSKEISTSCIYQDRLNSYLQDALTVRVNVLMNMS